MPMNRFHPSPFCSAITRPIGFNIGLFCRRFSVYKSDKSVDSFSSRFPTLPSRTLRFPFLFVDYSLRPIC